MSELENQQPHGMQTPDYLGVIRARAWVIVLAVVVFVGCSFAYSHYSTSEYRTSTRLVYQTNTLDRTLFGAQVFGDSNQPRNVETAAQLVKVPDVAEAVKKQLDTRLSVGELLGMVSVSTSDTDNLVQIDAVSTDPQTAANVANAFAEQFVIFRQNTDRAVVASARQLVKTQLDGLSPTDASTEYGLMLKDKYESLQILEAMQNGGFTIVQKAFVPSSPFSPRPIRTGLLALFAGLVVGVGLAFLLDYVDKSVKDVETLEMISGVPVLAAVPVVGGRWSRNSGRDSKKAVGFASNPVLLESFRTLRSSLQYFEAEKTGKAMKTILVTSALPGDGKTVTAINLSLSLTLAGNRVVLLETDLRRPKVAEHLGLTGNAGLSTVLAEKKAFRAVLQPVQVSALVPRELGERVAETGGISPNAVLLCVASGPLPPNPAELLSSSRMATLIQELQDDPTIDYVVIDSPPVLLVADALAIAPLVDGVILVTRLNRSTREEIVRARDQLLRSGARVVGVVAGGLKARDNAYRVHGYYQYEYR